MEKIAGSQQNIVILIVYIILIVFAIALILKNEKKYQRILWLIVVILFPYIGSVIYLLKYFLTQRNNMRQY